jgi:uncharacterized membrane protein
LRRVAAAARRVAAAANIWGRGVVAASVGLLPCLLGTLSHFGPLNAALFALDFISLWYGWIWILHTPITCHF